MTPRHAAASFFADSNTQTEKCAQDAGIKMLRMEKSQLLYAAQCKLIHQSVKFRMMQRRALATFRCEYMLTLCLFFFGLIQENVAQIIFKSSLKKGDVTVQEVLQSTESSGKKDHSLLHHSTLKVLLGSPAVFVKTAIQVWLFYLKTATSELQ